MDTILATAVIPVYVSETGARSEILPVVYLTETVSSANVFNPLSGIGGGAARPLMY